MSRYIDADLLLAQCRRNPLFEKTEKDKGMMYIERSIIDDTPTADVVEVVRCKDCKFWGIPHANDIEKAHYCCRDNMWCMPLRFAEDFCSYGERKENGT